jgi:hypothetical protein
MKVIVKITDEIGRVFYYPKRNTLTYRMGGWRIQARPVDIMEYAGILNDTDEEIQYLERKARQYNCKIELIPIYNILGTYLSTLSNKKTKYMPFIISILLMAGISLGSVIISLIQ